MIQSTKRILLSIMGVILLLAACAPAVQATESPVDIADQVATAVALTVAAQNTQTAEAIPPATNTPLPTQTESVSPTFAVANIVTHTPFPTNTPLPTNTRSPTDTPEATVPPPLYSCDAFAQSPDYQAEFKFGDEFDIRWIIINTGTRPWPAGFDVKYSSGSKMTSVTVVEIPIEMKPNDRYTIVLDAVAPKQEGPQYMTWIVQGQLCYPSVIINVVK